MGDVDFLRGADALQHMHDGAGWSDGGKRIRKKCITLMVILQSAKGGQRVTAIRREQKSTSLKATASWGVSA